MRYRLTPLLAAALLQACGGSDEQPVDTDAGDSGANGDVLIPGDADPDAVEPDATVPDANQPDVVEPDAIEPDTNIPDVVQQDGDTPDGDAGLPDVPDTIVDDVVPTDVTPEDVAPDATPDTGDTDDVADDATDVGPAEFGRLRGRVTVAQSGQRVPVVGARVWSGDVEAFTDATGSYALEGVVAGPRTLVHVESNAVGEALSSLHRAVPVVAGTELEFNAELQSGCFAEVDTSVGVILPGVCGTPDGIVGVSLPANGVITESGEPVERVLVVMIPLPTQSAGVPSAAGLAVFPGDMQAVREDGTSVYLRSFGAVEVRLYDAATREPAQLAEGRTAELQFTAWDGALDEGPTMPLWSFDETTGLWIEEGTVTVETNPFSSYLVHRATVPHFSWWNADQPTNRTCVSGRLVDESGAPRAHAPVMTIGRDYLGASSAWSGADGRFEVFARQASQVVLRASAVGLGGAQTDATRLVETGGDATCVDVGDVQLDTRSISACARGQILDAEGTPVADALISVDVRGEILSYRTLPDGGFCMPIPVGLPVDLRVMGVAGGTSLRGTIRNVVGVAGSGVCSPTPDTCLDLGQFRPAAFSCIAGDVIDGAGPVPGARISVTGAEGTTYGQSDAAGRYCVPAVGGDVVELYARVDSFDGTSFGNEIDVSIPFGGSCSEPTSCADADVLLDDASCVRGTVTDAAGTPIAGAVVRTLPQNGGRIRTGRTGADGSFCAPARANQVHTIEVSYAEPGTRYFGSVDVSAGVTAATCGGAGCEDMGTLTLTEVNVEGCIRGRVVDGGRPFNDRIDVEVADRVAMLRADADGSFCADVPGFAAVRLVDRVDREASDGCIRPRETEVNTSALADGSCLNPLSCLDVGEVDFADFCFTS